MCEIWKFMNRARRLADKQKILMYMVCLIKTQHLKSSLRIFVAIVTSLNIMGSLFPEWGVLQWFCGYFTIPNDTSKTFLCTSEYSTKLPVLMERLWRLVCFTTQKVRQIGKGGVFISLFDKTKQPRWKKYEWFGNQEFILHCSILYKIANSNHDKLMYTALLNQKIYEYTELLEYFTRIFLRNDYKHKDIPEGKLFILIGYFNRV